MTSPPIENATIVADYWEEWCEPNAWTETMRRFGELGGLARWWCGYPHCASAIPLAFQLYAPDGTELPSKSRLRDIRAAVAARMTGPEN